jgi:hypothetical protein
MKRALPTGEVALASKIFEQFFAAEAFEDILTSHQNLCSVLQISPGHLSKFYPVIKVQNHPLILSWTQRLVSNSKLHSWVVGSFIHVPLASYHGL